MTAIKNALGYGLSPRVRGRFTLVLVGILALGFIPACAG